MEGLRFSGFDSVGIVKKKPRSNTIRRPRPDSQSFLDTRNHSPLSTTPPSDNENTNFDTSFRRKEFNLNHSASRVSSAPRKIRKDDGTSIGEFDNFYNNGSSRGGLLTSNEHGRNGSDFKRCSEGVLAPANWKSTSKVKENFELQSRNQDGYTGNGRNGDGRSSGQSGVANGLGHRGDSSSNESKLRKVKLKVGGVTRTIHAKSMLDSGSGNSSTKPSRSSDAPRPRQKLILQDNSDDERSTPDKANGLQGIPWKDFTLAAKEDSRGKMPEQSGFSSEPVRKSKRVPKKRVLDGALDDADEDDEIRYLERLKTSKLSAVYGAEYGDDGKRRRIAKSRAAEGEYDDAEEYGLSRLFREGKKKPRSGRESEDIDYMEEEEPGSDGGPDSNRKKQRKESVESLTDVKKEISLTTRQRALQSGKDVSTGNSASLIEFPDGLPPAPPRKQKEKLSEVEQQLKKAEAAQRRRMQVEKAARESEAEAIRKILGQDSNRKKKEDKLRKRRDELAQEKAANAITLASSTVRWVMGPTGTVVTFPTDVGLPSIFDSKPCSYPPPREKCAGPSCTNPYKYRDSKSKLPLCSLQCYRAIHENMQPVTTC